MINKSNFKTLLISLGFAEKDYIFSKKINGDLLRVDFLNEKLIYPKDIKVEGEFTTNFSSAENFVVFECVHRLLELGYKSEQLTLEPKWKVGHGASGGRADIVIKDNDSNVFAIIECKTAGKEFIDAWNTGLQYPSQLFSYAQQEGSTQLLCLYTSNLESDSLQRDYFVIPLFDNQSLLEIKEDQEEVATFDKAKRFDEKFNVWKNTYNSEAFSLGFFEEGIQPFHFGKKNYSINDLKEISPTDIQKKYHQFATILRKYNVSGRENAFDKLVNLFLCKVVDEQENPNNLSFYWKGRAYDNDFDLQDRLQRLYQQGMKQFLDEDVTYINQEQIDEAFRFLEKDNDPDATKETINRYFKQLKFFTNNDFAFIDVHNERLFRENAEVLRSIVEMLQGIKLKNDTEEHSNQFLGDMFEGFLDAGVKQSEGQFFTPMPIVKFIINSLPLENILVSSEQPPKAIDYACGAGHFLTELARQLKPLVKEHKNADTAEYFSNITGIEKEYRLSKVAKVSAFMYGQDQIKIVYADALAKNNEIQNGTYDILVANPPYSVKGFLETLKHTDRRAYDLFGGIDEKSIITNNSIETFFIEKAKHLLAPNGVAAIILPSSILSNDANQYRQTREILIKNFHIIAIAELGSGTFGKTGTNTVTLFLRRRQQNPDEATHYRYRAQCWIDGDTSPRTKKNKQYNDLHLLESYCNHINIPFADYKYFLTEELPNETLAATDWWKNYVNVFNERTDVKNYKKKPIFKTMKPAQQEQVLAEMLARYIKQVELEKLYYYLLAQSNAVPVLVIKSPADNKAMKKFLGYEWSAAKGSEGIKYLNNTPHPDTIEEGEPVLIAAQLNAIQTPLYNPAKKDDADKINHYININFLGIAFTLPEALKEFAHNVRLQDMIDFERKDFNKSISLSTKSKNEFISKWETKKLGEVCKVLIGGTPSRNNKSYFEGNNLWVSIGEMSENIISDTKEKITDEAVNKSNVKLIPKGTTLLSFKLSIGKTAIAGEDLFTNEAIAGLIPLKENIYDEYLFHLFSSKLIDLENTGNKAFGKSLNSEFLREEVKIPLPPKNIQQKIIDECRVIDIKLNDSYLAITEFEKEISDFIFSFLGKKLPLKRFVDQISELLDPNVNSGKVVYIGLENLEKNTGQLTGEIFHEYSSIKSTKAKFKKGDILYGKLRPNLNKVHLSEYDGICSTDILVLRPINKEILS